MRTRVNSLIVKANLGEARVRLITLTILHLSWVRSDLYEKSNLRTVRVIHRVSEALLPLSPKVRQ